MDTLQAYGYVEPQPCECLDCGCEIQAGWRCFRCATAVVAALHPAAPYAHPVIDQGQFIIDCEVNYELFGPAGSVSGWAVE